MPASRAWRTLAATGKEREAGRGDGAGRRRWAGSGEVGVVSLGSARGCPEVAAPRGGDEEGEKGWARVRKGEGEGDKCGSKRVPMGAFCATRIPGAQAADSSVVVYVAGAHKFNSPMVSKIPRAHKFDMHW
jgi:hypothetical protein